MLDEYTVFCGAFTSEYPIQRIHNVMSDQPVETLDRSLSVIAMQVPFRDAAHIVNTLRTHGVEDWTYEMLPHTLFVAMIGDEDWHDYVPAPE